VAAGSIALGVAALILALGALTGFQEALRKEILDRTPHLEASLPRGADPQAAREALLALPGVEEVQILIRGRGWILGAGRVQPVDVVGFGGDLPRSFPEASDRGSGLYVSRRTALSWGLDPGDFLEVVSPRPTLGPLGPQPRARTVPLRGTFVSGKAEDQERVAVPLEVGSSLFGEVAYRLEVSAFDSAAALGLVEAARAALPHGSGVKTWQELNRPLFFALRLEKTVMFLAVALILAVAALALVADITLVIATKRRELAILAAMGATPFRLQRAMVYLGLLLTLLGAAAGCVLGLVGAWALDHYRLLSLPGHVYFLNYVPFQVRFQDLSIVLSLTLILALASCLAGVRRLAATAPMEEIRD
jgi:lipoprotein-releasing system permease protein